MNELKLSGKQFKALINHINKNNKKPAKAMIEFQKRTCAYKIESNSAGK